MAGRGIGSHNQRKTTRLKKRKRVLSLHRRRPGSDAGRRNDAQPPSIPDGCSDVMASLRQEAQQREAKRHHPGNPFGSRSGWPAGEKNIERANEKQRRAGNREEYVVWVEVSIRRGADDPTKKR
jgi:hypothetical protein